MRQELEERCEVKGETLFFYFLICSFFFSKAESSFLYKWIIHYPRTDDSRQEDVNYMRSI